MQPFESQGYWWLPDRPSERVAGVLKQTEKGFELSLFGALREESTPFQGRDIPIIHGIAWDCPAGSTITLKDCVLNRFRTGLAGVSREGYFVRQLFGGAHLGNEGDFKFSELSLSVSGLPAWAESLTGLSSNRIEATATSRGGTVVRWQAPPDITGPVRGGTLTLGVDSTFTMKRHEYTIVETPSLHISTNQPESVQSLHLRYGYPLQNFISFATDHPCAITNYEFGRGESQRVEFRFARIYANEDAAQDLVPHKMLFTFDDVRGELVDLLRRWLDLSERLRDVVEPYFGIQYRETTFVDLKFLTVFQALELYDRRLGADAQVNDSEVALAKRFGRLLAHHLDAIGPLFGDDVAKAVNEIIQYRNYIVHHDSELGKSPAYSADLYWMTQKLMMVMKACLLSELGMTSKRQAELFARNQLFIHMRGREAAGVET
jgi:hypothetical protein